MEDGEKEETAGEEQAKALWAEATKKKKRRRGQKVEKPEAFMANFFKGLEVYQTKLLVSAAARGHLREMAAGFGMCQGRTWGLRSLASSASSHSPSSSHLPACFLLCWGKRKGVTWQEASSGDPL